MTTDEIYAAAAEAYSATHPATAWQPVRDAHPRALRAAVDAVAPLLIAQGRREAAEAIRALDVQWIRDVQGDTLQIGLTVAANIAEGGTPS